MILPTVVKQWILRFLQATQPMTRLWSRAAKMVINPILRRDEGDTLINIEKLKFAIN
jgi:hypothetical protein